MTELRWCVIDAVGGSKVIYSRPTVTDILEYAEQLLKNDGEVELYKNDRRIESMDNIRKLLGNNYER